MKTVTVSAPGKLHLSGEHAVVYGKPAALVSTSLRLTVTLSQENDEGKPLAEVRKNDTYIDAIVAEFENKHNQSASGLTLSVASDIPTRAGMGSSAALAVALVGALVRWYSLPWDLRVINDLAYKAEKHIHGNPSGSDPAIVTHGGILWYRREFDALKTFWLLPYKIPSSFAPFVLINTGREETTGDLVSHVAALKKRDEKTFTLLMSGIEDTTRSLVAAIHAEDESGFRHAITRNQRLLEQLDVVSDSTRSLIGKIESAGGVAKISGAGGRRGGSGIVIAMYNDPSVIAKVVEPHGFHMIQTDLVTAGVRPEGEVA